MPPLFVLGCPRSGTTLLAQLLRHTPWGPPVETHFITKYAKRVTPQTDLRDRATFDRLVRAILAERPVKAWEVEADLDAIYGRMGEFDYARLVDEICLLRARKKGRTAWGDKTPHYILEVDLLVSLFPDSKYLYIVRDGRDVALSLLERPWGPGTVYHCADYWRRCNETTSAMDRLHSNGQLCELRYEDLLARPQEILQAVYSFLDVPWDEGKMKPIVDGIRVGNRDKWKERMSPAEVRLFETVAADTLARFDYKTTYPQGQVSPLRRACYALQDRTKWLLHILRLNILDTIKIKYFGKKPFGE